MPVENATYIAELTPSWPLGTHDLDEGNDHLNLIKGVLQSQFPNLGTSAPVNATETELNYLVGATSSIQAQLDTVNPVEVGMRFVCVATSLPVNNRWVLDDQGNDITLILRDQLSASGGGTWFHNVGLSNRDTGETLLSAQQSGVKPHGHSYGTAKQRSDLDTSNPVGYMDDDNGTDLQTAVHPGEAADLPHDHPGSIIDSDGLWRPAHREVVVLRLNS